MEMRMNAVTVAVLMVAMAAKSAGDVLLSQEQVQGFAAIEEKFKSMKADKESEEQAWRRFAAVNPAQEAAIIGALRSKSIDVADIRIAVVTIASYSVGHGSRGFMHKWYAETENNICGGILKIKRAGIADATRIYESGPPNCVEKKSDRRENKRTSGSGEPNRLLCSSTRLGINSCFEN